MKTLNIFLFFIMKGMVCWSMTHMQMCGYFVHCYAAIFLHDGFNCRNGPWCHYSVCLTRSRRVCYGTDVVHPLVQRMTERCSSLVHVASGAAIFTLLLPRRVAFLHRTATCRPLFKPWLSLLQTYKSIELCSNFYLTFKVFIWLSLVVYFPSSRILDNAWYDTKLNISGQIIGL